MASRIGVKNFKASLNEDYILILTANSVERDAIERILTGKRRADVGFETKGATLGLLKDSFALHITGESGFSYPLSVGKLATQFFGDPRLPKPSLVILAGFCWGNPAYVQHGDVIIGDSILNLNRTTATSSGTIPKGLHIGSAVTVSQHAELVAEVLASAGVTAKCGMLGSSEVLFMNARARDEVVERFPELLGGEMEAFAFVGRALPWLVVKGVSDMADESFDRTHQLQAATAAATAVLTLADNFDYLGLRIDETPPPAAERERLTRVLMGEIVELHAADIAGDSLSDQVNDELGPSLELSLRRYLGACSGQYDQRAIEALLALLLEIAQNALSHGRAKRVSVKFSDTKILYSDDGKSFDPLSITGDSGGAIAMSEFHALPPGLVDLEVNNSQPGNRYTLNLMRMADSIDEIRRECALTVVAGQVSRQIGGGEVFDFDESCTTVYLDAGQVLSISRRLELGRALKEILKEGRRLIIGCRGDHDRKHFLRVLGSVADQVTFVDVIR